ncbi:hypothetical protein ML462_05945 [Gramella lutea]|uniref:Uncharacterized protein n=1 Tax=Christiangramia lutea TaxID=1607951 RepID=A0A9X1V2X3_9FLAO|nr:hypothetical protein [Christiangramia lutea]MCH4822711.1 hypothetical protein [Christiangramia lutea]
MKRIALSIMTMGAMFFATQMHAQEEEIASAETTAEMVQEEFASVDVQELPEAVKDALSTDHANATVTEAWIKTMGETQVYKLKLDVEGETKKVYIDQDGSWVDMKDHSGSY